MESSKTQNERNKKFNHKGFFYDCVCVCNIQFSDQPGYKTRPAYILFSFSSNIIITIRAILKK